MEALTAQTSLDYAAGSAAIVAPRSVFDTVGDLAIYRARWQQRCAHYTIWRAYYEGTAYDNQALREALKLYSGVRQIFGPLRRAVRIDVAKVPGGWRIDAGNPDDDRAAVPTNVKAAVQQIRAWSEYRASYSRAVLHGAVAGEFGLLVVDDQVAKQVQIIPLRPDEVVLGTFADGTPFGLVLKCALVDRAGTYEYAALYTARTVATYRNGLPHDYDGGGSDRPNLQGRVPVLLRPYRAGESGIGENAFAGAHEQLDRVNDATSQTLDVLQRNAQPITVFTGVEEVEMTPGSDAVILPHKDATASILAPELAVDQAVTLIQLVLNEFKNVLPQLILDSLVARNDLAYDTVVTLCMELIDHIREVRTHVDSAIETAERWAIEAGQTMGLFPGVDAALHHLDPDRPVLEPGPNAKLALEQSRTTIDGAKAALVAPRAALDSPGGSQADAATKEPA